METSREDLNEENEAHSGDSKKEGSFYDGSPVEMEHSENGSLPLHHGYENEVGSPENCKNLKELKRPPETKQSSMGNPKGSENGKSRWECNLCHYRTIKKSLLLQHCKTAHTNMKEFKCDLCEYSTNHKRGLIRHNKAVHLNIKEYKCQQCTKEFTQKSHMSLHIRTVHEGLKEFQCDKCSFESNRRDKLERHKKEVHGETKTHACEDCAFSTSIPGNLIKHIKLVHRNKCDQCNLNFTRKYNMTYHMMTVHNNGQIYKCDSCEFITKMGYPYLVRHKRTVHQKIKDHVCDCGFSTGKKSNLLRHNWTVHKKEASKIKCDLCDYFAFHKSHLKRHKRGVHDKIKEHVCECGFATARKHNLTKHKMVVHLGYKKFKCNACEFAATDKRVLQNHMKLHSVMTDSNEKNTVDNKDLSNESHESHMFPWILPDEQVKPPNSKKYAKETNACISLVKLDKNMSLQTIPDVRICPKSSNLITIEKPQHEEGPQKVATKGVINGEHPWSLRGIEDKITSVGNWLDKLKGKK